MASLFDDLPLVDWLPGETLFSLCSRLHVLWGHRLPRQTATLLFGHSQGGTHHDLPNRVHRFVAATSGAFGSAHQIVRNRTLLRYYSAFISSDDVTHAEQAMCTDSVVHLKLFLGILTSRFRANHPLKACEICIERDVVDHGWSYWHLHHQYPGVWTCPAHRVPLFESTKKSTGVERFGWHLPKGEALRSPLSHDIRQSAQAKLERLTRLTVELVEGDQCRSTDPVNLRGMHRDALASTGWLTNAGNLRLGAMAADFLEYVRPLRAISEFAALPSTDAEARVQLGRLLREMRTGTHPVRQVILTDWLLNQSGPNSRAPECVKPKVRSEAVVDPNGERRAQLVEAYARGSTTISRLARQFAVDPATAMNWAAEAGLASPRRPKVLKEPVRSSLIKLLRAGADKKLAADRFEISVSTVTRTLQTEVGLSAQWHRARQELARERARTAWERAIGELGHLGTKVMRQSEPVAYAWLYRNDHDWLRQHLVPRLSSTPGQRLDWLARDRELSTIVQRAAAQHLQSAAKGPLQLWHLYQTAPELKAKLRAMKRLPLTRQVLDAVLGRQTTPPLGDLFSDKNT